MQFDMFTVIVIIAILVVLLLASAIKILPEYVRGVVFFLGRFQSVKGPGLVIIIPGIQKMQKVSLRTVAMDVPPQEVITKDNVSARVNAVIYFRVVAADKAIINVENYLYATSQLAQTTLRSVCGQSELDELLAERDKINKIIQSILDKHTDPWGIKVSVVEVKAIELTEEMKRAMARQAESEREKRAKIIHAEGEFMAAKKIVGAADVMRPNPVALQLRYLQTLTEVAAEQNSTTIFPVPIDLFKPFLKGDFSIEKTPGGGFEVKVGEAAEKTPEDIEKAAEKAVEEGEAGPPEGGAEKPGKDE